MKLLNRYLLGQFFKNFFTVGAGFIAIYLLIDFFEKFDDFTHEAKPFTLVLQYFILTIPFIIDQLNPIFVLLSGVITLGILSHTNELTALKAGGIPLRLIIGPLIVGSVLCTTLFVATAQWLLPVTVKMTNNIWFEQVKNKVPLGIIRNSRYYYKGKNGFYSFAWPDPKQHVFRNFSFSRWNKNYNLQSLITAATANWDEEGWLLENGQIQKWENTGTYQISNFVKKTLNLPEHPKDFLIPTNNLAEQSLTNLYQEVVQTDTKYEKRMAWANFIGRISYLLLGIPLLLLGLPILLYSYRKWGRDLSVAVPASCGLAFIAWGLWATLQSLAKAGYVTPAVASFSIHIVFSIAGIFLLSRNNR